MSWPTPESTRGETAMGGTSMGILKGASEQDVAFLRALLNRRQSDPNSISERTSNGGEPMSRSRRVAMAITAALQQNEVASPSSNHSLSLYRDVTSSSPFVSQTKQISASVKSEQCDASTSSMTSTDIGSQKLPLPVKLYTVLSRPDFEDIVSWMPHGRAWKILQLDNFINRVLPLFLSYGSSQAQNLNAFVRLLKIWGFRQFTKGADASAFYHELFVRGNPQLLRAMHPSDANVRIPFHDASREPDFYNLAPAAVSGNNMKFPQGSASSFERVLQNQPTSGVSAGPSSLPILSLLQPKGSTIASMLLRQKNPDTHIGFHTNASCLNAIRAQMMKDLQACQSLHEETINYLQCARRVADKQVTVPPDTSSTSSCSDHTSQQVNPTSESNSPAALATGKKAQPTKKPKRKWLPPLGPANPNLLLKSPTSSNLRQAIPSAGLQGGPGDDQSSCEWLYTNPEVFASLSNSSSSANQTPY